jgi:hypothetical protein
MHHLISTSSEMGSMLPHNCCQLNACCVHHVHGDMLLPAAVTTVAVHGVCTMYMVICFLPAAVGQHNTCYQHVSSASEICNCHLPPTLCAMRRSRTSCTLLQAPLPDGAAAATTHTRKHEQPLQVAFRGRVSLHVLLLGCSTSFTSVPTSCLLLHLPLPACTAIMVQAWFSNSFKVLL